IAAAPYSPPTSPAAPPQSPPSHSATAAAARAAAVVTSAASPASRGLASLRLPSFAGQHEGRPIHRRLPFSRGQQSKLCLLQRFRPVMLRIGLQPLIESLHQQ